LVESDVNHTVDIYEWRNGVVHLLTDGVTTFQKGLIASPQVHAVSANGRDILFSVVDPGLTGFEQDGFANLYDARIGGGFEVPTPPVPCSEESCQGPLQASPALDGVSSSGFAGQGNLKPKPKPRPCAHKRGKRKRRCMARHRRQVQKTQAEASSGGVG
jgi:hypothetical protein